jgi:AraC-like DNA-binding protein
VLETVTMFERDGLAVTDVACRHGRGAGAAEPTPGWAICLVRRGCFVRADRGGVATLDPSTAFFVRDADEQRYDHPHDGGDDCTALFLDPALLASVFGGEPDLPVAATQTSPGLDLEHRALLAALRRPGRDGGAAVAGAGGRGGGDDDEPFEQALALATRILAEADAARVGAGAPRRGLRTEALVAAARESLAADPDQSLIALARGLAVSPHHLSRLFARATGHTIARHKMRLRTRAALERLAAGEDNLARLAADLGFADQSHLTRVVRAETGSPPAALRELLRRR